MFKNRGFIIFTVVVLAFIFYYTFNSENTVPKPPSLSYISRLNQKRIGIDKYLKEKEDSPIENKAQFKGLKYFDIDEKYKIIAAFELTKSDEKIILATSGAEIDTLYTNRA